MIFAMRVLWLYVSTLCILCKSWQQPYSVSQYSSQRIQRLVEKVFITGVSVGGTIFLLPQASKAQESSSLKEDVAQIASNLPGFGKPDIYYPLSWAGQWKATKAFGSISSAASQLPQFYQSAAPKREVQFNLSFIPYKNKIVIDRSQSAAAEISAMNADSPSIGFWTPSNPNVLKVTLANGLLMDYRVTKRAVETLPSDMIGVGYSEFGQITESSQHNPVPKTFGYRILARYKQINEGKIVGLLREYFYDSSLQTYNIDNAPPTVIVKSTVTLVRPAP